MPDYKKLYFHLFSRLSTVVEQLEQHNYGYTRLLLIQILTEAENAYLEEGDDPSDEVPV